MGGEEREGLGRQSNEYKHLRRELGQLREGFMIRRQSNGHKYLRSREKG